MRPLFNVPGVGAFVVAMGLASGYPIGAVLTARLRREGQLTVAEAERLMGFCNTAEPALSLQSLRRSQRSTRER